MQTEPSSEPRWVTKVFRLFPHPIFAAVVGLASLAVAAIFSLGAVIDGAWPLGIVAVVFGGGAYCIFAAILIRRRNRRTVKRPRQTDEPPRADGGEVSPHENDLAGLPPVPTSHLLLYLATIVVWEARIGTFLASTFGGVQLPSAWRYPLTLLHVLLTLLALRVGWQDIRRLRLSGGKVELTGMQTVLVVGIFLSFGVTAVVVFEMLRG